jgi:hypothetical protein
LEQVFKTETSTQVVEPLQLRNLVADAGRNNSAAEILRHSVLIRGKPTLGTESTGGMAETLPFLHGKM